jgi:glutamate-1-semialdehyde 2,1-aminomutase
MQRPTSATLFSRAAELLPGGVNSPVRAFRGVGGTPVFFRKGKGAWLIDVDGNRYVDHVGSWGPLILGHAHPAVVDAVIAATRDGTSFGAPHAAEVEIAQLICERFPSVEKLRLVSSGTEATSAACRLARGFTGRDAIVKLEGCYHGAADAFLVKAGSGVETLGLPDSPGVPAPVAALTLTAPFNDLDALTALFDRHGATIAAVILEPVVGNMGVLIPKEGYLRGVVELCKARGALSIFDEVMTGFRVAKGGAQELYGVTPDLTTMGKVIGGGLPVGAYGGRREIMSRIAPEGPIYQAGTLSGNPLAVAGGIACLKELGKEGVYERLEEATAVLCQGIVDEAKTAGVPLTVNRVGSMWTAFFTDRKVFDYATAKSADTVRFGRFFHALLDEGVYLPPSQFEAAFLSLAHGGAEIDHTLSAVRKALRSI